MQDAKNRFSAADDAALAQEVSHRGKPAVVILSVADDEKMWAGASERRGCFVQHLPHFPTSRVPEKRTKVAAHDVDAASSERSTTATECLNRQDETKRYLSVITLGEIERVIAMQERTDLPLAHDLREWLTRAMTLLPDRLPGFRAAAAQMWGRFSAQVGHAGAELLIAATALTHRSSRAKLPTLCRPDGKSKTLLARVCDGAT